MDFLSEFGLFLAEAVTVVFAIGAIVLLIAAASQRQRSEGEGRIEVHRLNDRYKHMGDSVREAVADPATAKGMAKRERKAEKKAAKARARAAKKQRGDGSSEEDNKPRLFVLDFNGDLRASDVDNLREEISVLLTQMRDGDEVLLRLESGGGLVHSYGLAASQLERIRHAGHPLTVSVDRVAASGGYMMACVANRIIAAPFAVIGSIGVLAQLPNFHRLLKKNDIDFEMITAGEYKRTLTLFGENTDKGRDKFREDIEDTHALFKAFVKDRREILDIDRVATGEVWFGQRALDVNLVDALQTSDDYIQEHLASHGVFEISYMQRKTWQQKLGLAAEGALERSVFKLWQAAQQRPPQ
jgi:serine protease SohB